MPFFTIEDTAYGGRGAFCSQFIPKGSLIHICPSPYASVIYQKFRREVCASCFAYSFTANRNTWNIKSELATDGSVSFCSLECRALWVQTQNIDGLLGIVSSAVEKVAKTMRKTKLETGLYQSSNPTPLLLNQAAIDLAWAEAEKASFQQHRDITHLDPMELDIAMFIVSAILKRYHEDKIGGTTETWHSFLSLQDNELAGLSVRPEALNTQLRVYSVLRRAFSLVKDPLLQTYVSTSETVRAIFQRDFTNAFGLWEEDWIDVNADPTKEHMPDEESEMFGWGMYISGSFFNHDCTPNVRKLRVGRAYHFFTSRDVSPGDELCINYVGVAPTDKVVARRAELHSTWYFECNCTRCSKESEVDR